MSQTNTCSTCDSRWTGTSRAHCSGCHQTFGGVTGFDMHRSNYACRHPADVGLTQDASDYWVRSYFADIPQNDDGASLSLDFTASPAPTTGETS